jgi:hypothetical protein
MLGGTVFGLLAGLLIADPLSRYVNADLLDACALLGIFAGWAVAFQIGRRIAPSR